MPQLLRVPLMWLPADLRSQNFSGATPKLKSICMRQASHKVFNRVQILVLGAAKIHSTHRI